MVDLLTIQTVGVIVAAFSFVVGIANNIITSRREENRNQQQLETRQAQLFMSLHDSFINVETLKIDFELMEWKWKDYDDFQSKYESSSNLDARVKRHSLHYRLDNVGWLVKCGVVDPEWAYNQLAGFILYHWVKFKYIYYEERKREGIPIYENFEYLAMVCDRIGKDKGINLETIRRSSPDWFPEQST